MEIEEIKLIILESKNCRSCTCILGTRNKLEKMGGVPKVTYNIIPSAVLTFIDLVIFGWLMNCRVTLHFFVVQGWERARLLGSATRWLGSQQVPFRVASRYRPQGIYLPGSVPDPDPHVFGPHGSGSISQRYGSGPGYFCQLAKIVRKTLIPTVLWLLLDFLSLKNDVQ